MTPPVIEIERETLQVIFDLAVNSLDFGSGFWDSDETIVARKVARLLGVDPMLATPSAFRSHFSHNWEGRAYPPHFRFDPNARPGTYDRCIWCEVMRADHETISVECE